MRGERHGPREPLCQRCDAGRALQLKDRHQSVYTIHILSRDSAEAPITSGRIDADKLRDLAKEGLITPATADAIYFCGPGDMIETGRKP